MLLLCSVSGVPFKVVASGVTPPVKRQQLLNMTVIFYQHWIQITDLVLCLFRWPYVPLGAETD